MFNVYINDIFYIIKDVKIINFVDDKSSFIFNKLISKVVKLLDSNKLYSWYGLNGIKPNADKYHLHLSSHDENLGLLIKTDTMNNSSEEKLLGVTFYDDFA